jgi:hypothetical protein
MRSVIISRLRRDSRKETCHHLSSFNVDVANGDLGGMIPHGCGTLILQYVDGTILFIEDDIYQAKNLKLAVSTFEQLL